jgi:23S rRNA G2445 N2-methylase RlmL
LSSAAPRRAAGPLRLVVTCSPGLEPLLERELVALGYAGVDAGRSAIHFAGDWEDVWRANYWLRTANRVLVEIASFPASTSEELYDGASAVLASPASRSRAPGRSRAGATERGALGAGLAAATLGRVSLAELLAPVRTFAVAATSTSSRLRDTRWVALRVKDAIADSQRARFGRRADVDARQPEVPLRVWLHQDRATLLLDASREPLDRRGYRRVSGVAPLREQLAAACVLASGWEGDGPFVDPMCGTGTLLVEAAWIALGRAPGCLRREWVFERWPGFDRSAFERVRAQGPERASAGREDVARSPPAGSPPRGVGSRSAPRLHGRDLSGDAIRAAHANLEAAGVAALADVSRGDAFAFQPPAEPGGLVVLNPAYGERLESSDEDWRRIGDLLKQRYTGWRCAVIAGAPSFGKHIGLRPRRRIPVKNGPLDAKILVFDLYQGRGREADA